MTRGHDQQREQPLWQRPKFGELQDFHDIWHLRLPLPTTSSPSKDTKSIPDSVKIHLIVFAD